MKGIRIVALALLVLGVTFSFGGVARAQGEGDIVDIAVADGRFETLVTAVQAADLVDALKAEGPLTVFAPTDDAFAKLPAGTVEALLGDIPTLTDILLYHVVSGKVMAADVVTLSSAEMLNGDTLSITVRDGNVYLNDDVQVIITDIEASNGVIHVIDTVLLPPAEATEAAAAEAAATDATQTILPAAGAPGAPVGNVLPVVAATVSGLALWAARKWRR